MGLFGKKVGSPVGEEVVSLKGPTATPEDGIFWAGQTLDWEEACKHFVTVGATGSGKSITLNLLMQSVLGRNGKAKDTTPPTRRALVYDSKLDLVSFLSKMLGGTDRIRIMNPMDERFCPWDIAADVTTETDAFEFASILIPKGEHESSPYFADASRNLVAGVIIRFNATLPGKWSLRDLILAFDSKDTLQQILNHPQTRHLQDHFSEANERNFSGVKSTVDNTMALYRPIAALFEAVPKDRKRFSLRTWLKSDKVLVFGNSESAREATDTLNRLMFRQISKMIISRDGKIKNDETWIFLDELREAGPLQGLRQLLLRGRSKGVAVAIGFQDVEGIYEAYGEHGGAEIIGSAENTVLLHLNPTATKTTEWASQVLGSRRDFKVSQTKNRGGQNLATGSDTTELDIKPNVLAMEFSGLPMPSKKNGLQYFAFTETGRYIRSHYSAEFLDTKGPFSFEKIPNLPNEPDFKPHDPNELKPLKPWDGVEIERLKLTAAPHSSRKNANPLFEEMPLPPPKKGGLSAVKRGDGRQR